MGNKSCKKYNKIKSFSLPVSLKEEKDNIYCNNCFSNIPFNKLEYEEQYLFNHEEFVTGENSSINNTKSLDITNKIDFIVQNDTDFKSDLYMDDNLNNKTSYHLYKYILCTVKVDKSQIHFNDYYKKLFKKIAKSKDDNDKASRLEEVFKSTGFYVPLQIDIGGMFMSSKNFNNMNYSYRENRRFYNSFCFNDYLNNEINYNNLNNNQINKLFLNNKRKIIGGNIYEERFEYWKESINERNAMPVGYKDFHKITDFISDKIKYKLEKPLKIVEKKYDLRRKYLEIIEDLKKKKKERTFMGNLVIIMELIKKEMSHIFIVNIIKLKQIGVF